MKRYAIALALGVSLIAPAVHAQEASSTPMVGGHRHALVAGSVDSINHRGAWILENGVGKLGVISYVTVAPVTAEEVRVKGLFDSFMALWNR